MHVRYLIDNERKEKIERDKQIVKGLGEFTLAVHQGQREVDPDTLGPVWDGVKQSDTGVKFEDVFDPHLAEILEKITPQPDKGTDQSV